MPRVTRSSTAKTARITSTKDVTEAPKGRRGSGKSGSTPPATPASTKKGSTKKASTKKGSTKKATKKTTSGDEAETGTEKSGYLFSKDAPESGTKGGGFKDSQTAKATIDLVKHRSLAHQYAYISTMNRRAGVHAHTTPGIQAAVAVFKEWLEVTLPALREAQRDFKPLVPKDIVEKLRLLMEESGITKDNLRFVDFYTQLPKNARIASQIVHAGTPDETDWDVERYEALCEIVPEGRETQDGWEYEELWDDDKLPTKAHLEMIAWAFSPAPARTLAARVKDLE